MNGCPADVRRSGAVGDERPRREALAACPHAPTTPPAGAGELELLQGSDSPRHLIERSCAVLDVKGTPRWGVRCTDMGDGSCGHMGDGPFFCPRTWATVAARSRPCLEGEVTASASAPLRYPRLAGSLRRCHRCQEADPRLGAGSKQVSGAMKDSHAEAADDPAIRRRARALEGRGARGWGRGEPRRSARRGGRRCRDRRSPRRRGRPRRGPCRRARARSRPSPRPSP